MSDNVEITVPEKEEPEISVSDLQRMLDESRSRNTALERERDEARSARVQAEQERDTAATRVVSEAEQRWEAQKRAFEGNISAAESDAERAESDYAKACEAGDWAAAGKAQRAIAAAEARANQFRVQKDYLESNKESLVSRPMPTRTAPPSTGDKYAPYVSGLLNEERAWLDQRPNFISDPKYRQIVLNASVIAEARGNPRGSEGYFRAIEQIIGEEGGEDHTPAPRPRTQSADLAPQRRTAPGASPTNSREISLTADQVEVADALYGNPASPDYVADKAERYRKYHTNMQKMKDRH